MTKRVILSRCASNYVGRISCSRYSHPPFGCVYFEFTSISTDSIRSNNYPFLVHERWRGTFPFRDAVYIFSGFSIFHLTCSSIFLCWSAWPRFVGFRVAPVLSRSLFQLSPTKPSAPELRRCPVRQGRAAFVYTCWFLRSCHVYRLAKLAVLFEWDRSHWVGHRNLVHFLRRTQGKVFWEYEWETTGEASWSGRFSGSRGGNSRLALWNESRGPPGSREPTYDCLMPKLLIASFVIRDFISPSHLFSQRGPRRYYLPPDTFANWKLCPLNYWEGRCK